MELFCQFFLFGFLLFYSAWSVALVAGTLRGFFGSPSKPRAVVRRPRRDWLWASLPQMLRSDWRL